MGGKTMATFNGTTGNDVANAGNGTLTGFTGGTVAELQDGVGDLFNGNNGADTIFAAGGADTILAGAGDDFLAGRGGADSLDGGTGFDEVRYDLDAAAGGGAGVTVNLGSGTATDGFGLADTLVSIEAVRGTAQVDNLTGSNRTDEQEQFSGLAGNDIINGQGGFDEVRYDRDAGAGGGGAVTVNLALGTATDGFGNTDTLIGIESARGTALGDTFVGDGQNNQFRGLGGADTFDGGTGIDELRYDSDQANGGLNGITANFSGVGSGTVTDGFGATDTFQGMEVIRGTSFADTFNGSAAGSEEFFGLAGADTLNGGTGGLDWARYDRDGQYGGALSVNINLTTGIAIDGFGNTDTLNSIEAVVGTANSDVIRGSAAANHLVGNGGFDQFWGLAGNDTITGFQGNGILFYGDDQAAGGGLGIVVTFTGLNTGTVIDGFGNTDTFFNLSDIRGTALADNFSGGSTTGSTSFTGFAGADTFTGGTGIDGVRYDFEQAVNGSAVAVSVNLAAGTATDTYGSTDTLTNIDFVSATTFADTIIGDGRDNTFDPRAGNDTVDGGAGYDIINYGSSNFSNAQLINFTTGVMTDGLGGTDAVTNVEEVRLGGGNDTIIGSARWDNVQGNSGSDSFVGGGGSDWMRGGAGNDTIDGSAGGGLEAEMMQSDFDTAAYDDAGIFQAVNINLNTGVAIDGFGNTDQLIDIERVRGTQFADTFLGSATANFRQERFEGLGGNDTINGQGGFDISAYERDRFYGGVSGVNVNLSTGFAIDGFGSTDTLIGVEGARGTIFADTFLGGTARNWFRSQGGADTIDGGADNDTFSLYFGDQIGGTGVSVNLATGTGVNFDATILTISNVETIDGSYGNDTIVGSTNADNLSGDLGNDSISGGGGDDTISGGAGTDTLVGGNGSDWLGFVFDISVPVDNGLNANQLAAFGWLTQNWNWTGVTVNLATGVMSGFDGAVDTFSEFENLFGTYLADSLTGDSNANSFRGYAGNDTIDGGGGSDTVFYSRTLNSLAGIVVQNGTGDDPNGVYVDLIAGTAADGHGTTDTLISIENVIGSEYGDQFVASSAANSFDGRSGVDYVRYDTSAAIQVDLQFNNGVGGLAQGDTYAGIEGIVGTAGSDGIWGNTLDNAIYAEGGSDWIDGRDGADYINAGAGFDNLTGGAGADYLDGGADYDYARYETATAGVQVDLSTGQGTYGDAQGDVYVGIEGVVATNFADIVIGDGQQNVVYSWFGADYLDGGAGFDYLFSFWDNDTLTGGADGDYLDGGDGFDYARYTSAVQVDLQFGGGTGEAAGDIFLAIEGLIGSGQADGLYGSAAGNYIYAGGGNDWIVGRQGADNLIGEGGADTFVFNIADLQAGVRDVIEDFSETGGNFDYIRFEGLTPGTFGIGQFGSDVLMWVALSGGGFGELLVKNTTLAAVSDQYYFV